MNKELLLTDMTGVDIEHCTSQTLKTIQLESAVFASENEESSHESVYLHPAKAGLPTFEVEYLTIETERIVSVNDLIDGKELGYARSIFLPMNTPYNEVLTTLSNLSKEVASVYDASGHIVAHYGENVAFEEHAFSHSVTKVTGKMRNKRDDSVISLGPLFTVAMDFKEYERYKRIMKHRGDTDDIENPVSTSEPETEKMENMHETKARRARCKKLREDGLQLLMNHPTDARRTISDSGVFKHYGIEVQVLADFLGLGMAETRRAINKAEKTKGMDFMLEKMNGTVTDMRGKLSEHEAKSVAGKSKNWLTIAGFLETILYVSSVR